MIVLSRMVGEAIYVEQNPVEWIITVAGLRGDNVGIAVTKSQTLEPGQPRLYKRDDSISIAKNIDITVVDIRGDKVRLGINAPRECSIHRLEVARALRRERGGDDDGATGTPVPRPPTPRPPELRVGLDEPRPDDESFGQ
jgi:carbon storage regulator